MDATSDLPKVPKKRIDRLLEYATNYLFIIGIFCYVSLLSLMPFMHVYEHEHHDDHCPEHHDSEPTHTDARCPACVFDSTYVDCHIQPTVISSNSLSIETLPLVKVSFIAFNPTTSIQNRSPPIFSD